MATQSYTVYSDYDSERDRERLLRETGQTPDDDAISDALDPEEQWRREASKIYGRSSLATSAPKFVPAKVADGEWDGSAMAPTLASTLRGKGSSNIAGWYQSLTASSSSSAAPTPPPSRPPSAPVSTTSRVNPDKRAPKPDRSNWFIQNVIPTSSGSSSSHTPFSISLSSEPSSTPAPTLADILEREPPQKGKYTPPAWIALGPGNKGFGILQKSGWNEGEALGPYAVKLKTKDSGVDVDSLLGGERVGTRKGKEREVRVEYLEVPATRKRARDGDGDGDDEVTEVKRVEVVDLTLESEDSEGGDSSDEAPSRNDSQPIDNVKSEEVDDEISSHDGHGGTALLTPLSTILKSDKLGIGLKPKLTSSASSKGAYRVPVLKDTRRNQVHAAASKGFRVTSTQGVLDELRRREREEREKREFGKGTKGKGRKRRKEEEERKGLLAYMNN